MINKNKNMKLLDFDSFINESLNEKISNKVFLNDIADSDYTEVEVSLRYAREVGELFNNSFKRYCCFWTSYSW